MSEPWSAAAKRLLQPCAAGIGLEVPLTRYQEYFIRRSRLEKECDLATDVGRFRALIWFIEAYAPHRAPLMSPFSAEQIRWLLSPTENYMSKYALPRIVEAFWRRSLLLQQDLHPFDREEDFIAVAYWWSIERAREFGIEGVLTPSSFIEILAKPSATTERGLPVSNFLRMYMERNSGPPWSVNSDGERLADYIHVLFSRHGLHASLFFPEEVMRCLRPQTETALEASHLFRIDQGAVHGLAKRVAEADVYRANHKRIRSGMVDVLSPYFGQSWETTSTPAPKAAHATPIVLAGRDSAFPSPVRLIGPLNSQSGLGQATRMSTRSLLAAGVQPVGLDFDLDNPAVRTLSFIDGEIVPGPFAINLIHLNGESTPLAPAYLRPAVFENAYNIGYFFWELPNAARVHELALEVLDEIWVSSEFNRESYARVTDKPVKTVGMAVEALPDTIRAREDVRRERGLSMRSVVYMTTFDTFSFVKRKNPAAALRAFLLAFGSTGQDVLLVVKTHNMTAVLGETHAPALIAEVRDLVARDERILLIDETLPYADLIALKSACDCYVSLHRSEGWGFGMLEAMQLGLPVIATAFSGNLEFCTPETAFNVGYTPVYLDRDDYIFVQPGDFWAEPDLAQAAAFMREVHDDPAAARARGAAAKAFVETHFSAAAVGRNYLRRLEDIRREFAPG